MYFIINGSRQKQWVLSEDIRKYPAVFVMGFFSVSEAGAGRNI